MQEFRFEFKYKINPKDMPAIEHELQRFGMKLDKNTTSESGGYCVTSLYFDSYDLSDYNEKEGGYLIRKKVRARIYEPYLDKSEKVRLEIKNKINMQGSKSQVWLTREEFDNFLKKGASALVSRRWGKDEEEKKHDILWNLTKRPIKPVAVVRYLRRAFMDETKKLRVNFDNNLETCKGGDLGYNKFMSPVDVGGIIMEVKYAIALPYWFENIIKKHNLTRIAFSKYTKSLEEINKRNPLPR